MNNFQFFLNWVGEHPLIFMMSLFLILLFFEGVAKIVYHTVNNNGDKEGYTCKHGFDDSDECSDCCH